MSEPTNTPLQDTIDRLQQCQGLLIEMKELNMHKEEHAKRLAVCEEAVEEGRSMVERFDDDRATNEAAKAVMSIQANLAAHRDVVRRHLRTLKELKLIYRELILGWLNKADSGWLHQRRETVLAAFNLAKDVHVLLMRKSEDLFPRGGKKKQRPVKVYQVGRRSRETLKSGRLSLHSKRDL